MSNRRQFIAGSAAAAASLTIPATAAAATVDRTAWDSAMRAYLAAKAEADAFMPEMDRVYADWTAQEPSLEMIDWQGMQVNCPVACLDKRGSARTLDLDDAWQRFVDGEGRWWWSDNPEQQKAEFRATLDTVRAYREEEARVRHSTGIDEACERMDALSDAQCDADSALMATPAPDLAALRHKLEKLLEISNGATQAWEESYAAQTIADVQRLLV